MTKPGPEIVVVESQGGIAVRIAVDGEHVVIGPVLHVETLGGDGEAHGRALFADIAWETDGATAEVLARVEQFALDRLFAGPTSAREAARARVIVTWAVLVLQALPDRGVDDVGRRLDRLVALLGSERVDPLHVADMAPVIVPPAPPNPGGERGIIRQVRAYARRRRALRDVEEAQGQADQDAVAREIALHPFRNRWAIFSEIGASIAFTTFASAGSFVFLGTRLQKCAGPCRAGGIAGFSASLDIIALVICSFGFLFATLSYANATGVLARLSTLGYPEALERGNRVSEYFGVYPLIFAIPLAVEQSTSSPIPLVVSCVGLVAFLGYHAAHRFSLLERVIANGALGSDRLRRWVIAGLLVLLALVWFGPELLADDAGLWLRVLASGLFLSVLLGVYWLASIVPEQPNPGQFRVHRDDLLSEESPSLYDLRPPSARP